MPDSVSAGVRDLLRGFENMCSTWGRKILFLLAFLAVPALGFAQEAVLTGTITDTTGAVLPGVTVVAINDATGNRFESVTDERGIYRVPARVGTYTITADLQGFSAVKRPNIQVL